MPGEEVDKEVQEIGLSTAKRGVIFLLGKFASSLVVLFLLVFLARYLQPADYGIYSIAVAFSGLLGIGSAFGIGTAFRKMLPEIKKDHKLVNEIISNGYVLASGIGLAIGIAGYLASGYIATSLYGNAALTFPLQLASIAEFIGVLFNLALAALVGLNLVKEATISNIAYSIFNLIASVGLVIAGYGVVGAVAGMLVGLLAGSLVGLAYIVIQKWHRLVSPTRKAMKKLTGFSIPVVTSHVATLGAQNLAVMLLGLFATSVIVGNYSAAFKLARFIELSITSITFVLLPAFSSTLSSENVAHKIGSIYNKSLYYTALILFPLVAYMASTATPWLKLLVSSGYTLAPQYFVIIIAGMALGLIGTYAGTLVVGQGDVKRFMKYQVLAVVIQVALLLALTPYLQAVGVLVALFAITPIVLDIIYMKALEDQFKFKHQLRQFSIVAVSSIAIGLALYALSIYLQQHSYLIAVNAVLALLLFPPVIGLLGGIKAKDIKFIRDTAERLKPIRWLVHPIVSYAAIFARKD